MEVNTGPLEQCRTPNSKLPSVGVILQEIHPSPNGANPSSSYAEILKKNLVVSSGSFDDDSIEKISKKEGRKSRKEDREEETERLKMQGSQSTIEMALGRSKWSIPPKGVITPSFSGK